MAIARTSSAMGVEYPNVSIGEFSQYVLLVPTVRKRTVGTTSIVHYIKFYVYIQNMLGVQYVRNRT